MVLQYNVTKKDVNKTLKEFLKQHYFSSRLLITLKNNNAVFINSSPIFLNYVLKENDDILVDLNYSEENDNIVPTKMNLDIIYEDDAFIIVNKPYNMAVHPSCRHYKTSLSNGIQYYFNSIGLSKKIRPVNRLDKDTSGLVIFAKNEYIQECLIKQMQANVFKKEYIAIVDGLLNEKNGTINAPIARKENSIIERCINQNGDVSITHYEVLKEFENYSLVKFSLETGRTHQIRVHCKYIGHPILGDTLYGVSSELIGRQALHAWKISFIHPITQKQVNYITPIPDDIGSLL